VSIASNSDAVRRALFGSSTSDDAVKARVVAQFDWPFAHEGPVWLPSTGEVFCTSNQLEVDDGTGRKRVAISAVCLKTGKIREVQAEPYPEMANGATAAGGGNVVLCYQGYGDVGGGICYLDMASGESRSILSSFPCGCGRSGSCFFNSPNDVVFNADRTGLWFTDPAYGHKQGFRTGPQAQETVYYLDGATGIVIPAANHCFYKPNGVLLSPDGKTVYVTDTGFEKGDGTKDPNAPRHIYAFDAQPGGQLLNKRKLLGADVGIPDGLKCDTEGNVYIGTGDGVTVMSPSGELLAKLLVEGGVSNLVFGGQDLSTLVLCNQTRMIAVETSVQGALGND